MITGFVCGTFDLLHAGHIDYLRMAKNNCDRLLVGLQVDPSVDRPEKNKPIQSVLERQIQLLGTKYVDEIYVYETERDLDNLLGILNIDVRFIGTDWIPENITGKDICETRGIEIKYLDRRHNWSSSELRRRVIRES